MSYVFAVNTFNLEDITELTTEYPELSGDEETFYFKIVEEEEAEEAEEEEEEAEEAEEVEVEEEGTEETSDSNPTPTIDEEIVYSTDITSFHQINLVDVIKSIVEDNEVSDVESLSEEMIDSENQNSNIPLDQNQKESTKNMDSVIQNNIYNISSDSDENTEQISPIVNLKAVRFIKNQKRAFPTYYQTEIYTNLIQFLSYKTESDVVNSLIENTNGYLLKVKDLMTLLTPKTWLNDSVIQNYISLLMNYCDKTKEMNTDFLTSYKEFGYNSVYRWFKNIDLNNVNRLVVPINPGNIHWALFVIEIWEGKIYCFDSYKEHSFMKELTLITAFLNRAIIDYINCSGVQRTVPKDWKYIDGNSPKQTNTYDCGVFTCMNARYFLLNTPLSVKFTQQNMPILRQIISWELINSTLEPF
ncbi:uncharacterized protein LOC132933680 [Metopolophium dirhodum]|uniref:uncharacterized protein LOC132933680 n=1 Tax=Metopolophium dirhodum TaxID=44670 RepID=UPI00298FDE56|nr:uncharacterized protein LOC132933680 [Metopolophium dirhodum]